MPSVSPRGLIACLLFAATLTVSAAPPDLTNGGVPGDSITINLGPTGMRAVPLAQLMDGQIAALRHWARGRAREAATRTTPARNSRRLAEAN